ncbi:unnamed protein product [Staurois parvus]|uniref:Calcium-binding protein n=1 Tax=Staurois parvus TaxID=386267 RepID=A0ABN9AA72_9NEOB|nr:unnamed protein product [Staurois parvus]
MRGPGRADIGNAGSGRADIVNAGSGRADIVNAGSGDLSAGSGRAEGDERIGAPGRADLRRDCGVRGERM